MTCQEPLKFLFCPLRKKWIVDLPEEKVRQALIHKMVQELGYPPENIVIEKSLSQLPHIPQGIILPRRRTDLLVYAAGIHKDFPLYPLLLLECKSIVLNNKVLRQIIGYNQFIKSYFIAAVNQVDEYFGWFDPSRKDFVFERGLPSYSSLVERVTSIYFD
jgi:Type I restriction enzyme R protein N terminus (HSDR_N)